MKLKTSHRIFLGLLLGALVLFLLKEYIILPLVMLIIGLLSLFVPPVATAIDDLVSAVIRFIGICVSAVLLFIVYFAILTPISLLAKLFGRKDSLHLKKPADTNFHLAEKRFDPNSFEKMW